MSSISASIKDVRVDDYLNDKLQTFADFETLDSLLEKVREQQSLLKQQLNDAERTLNDASIASQSQLATVQRQAQDFDREQRNVDQRLLQVTNFHASDNAVQLLSSHLDKLEKLDIADAYVRQLQDVEHMRSLVEKQLATSPMAALESYNQLRTFATDLYTFQDAAEGAAPHLVDYVDKAIRDLKSGMRAAFEKEFEAILVKILWPKTTVTLPDVTLESWSNTVTKLLQLQQTELEVPQKSQLLDPVTPVAVLYPFEKLVQPLEQRFRYHFDGDKPTNKIDKPEYFLSHVIDLLNAYSSFMSEYIQPILLRVFGQTSLAHTPAYIDSTSALITALIPMLRTKIASLLPQISKQPQLLSHFLHELMSFDSTLRDEWQYDPRLSEDWKGLTYDVLVTHSWFEHWLGVERDFALARYKTIIDSADSGELDYDTVAPNVTKPTKAAIRVNDLLETITERYRPLSSFSQKLRFLIDIQINIFDRFYERLNAALEAYRTKTSSIGRTMQGVSAAEISLLQGPEGLDRLCRIYGSADYLEHAMRDWSDDVFFLDLWAELQRRALAHDAQGRTQNFAGPLSISDVTARTSSVIGAGSTEDSDAIDTGALFDETASAYRRLRLKSESVIIERLTHQVRESIRPYYRANPWTSLSTSNSADKPSTSDPATISHGLMDNPSSNLSPVLATLTTSFSFLAKALALLPLRRIARHVSSMLDDILWDRVIMAHSFSGPGASQLKVDVAALESVFERWIGQGQGRVGLRRVSEGLKILALATDIELAASGERADGERDEEDEDMDAWDADADAADGDGNDTELAAGLHSPLQRQDRDAMLITPPALSLQQVERLLFIDNASARRVLDDLRLDVLTEAEARDVVQRRVEIGM